MKSLTRVKLNSAVQIMAMRLLLSSGAVWVPLWR